MGPCMTILLLPCVTLLLPSLCAPTPTPSPLFLPRPFGVVIGGCKVKDKIKVLHSLIQKADVLCIGGRMAFTFLAAQGVAVGRTQVEEEWLQVIWDWELHRAILAQQE